MSSRGHTVLWRTFFPVLHRLINVQTCTAENLLNRNGDSKGPGYAARMLNAGNLTRDPADPLKRPNTAQPYSLHQQKRRLPGIFYKYQFTDF